MNLRSIFNAEEAAETSARGGPEEYAHVEYFGSNAGGAAGGKEYLLPFLRRMSIKAGQAREPGRRDNGLTNDSRVSPTDEGAGAAPAEEV